ncbi:MAG: GC-type dockerin domain-anchored protein [Phycisphaerales bacterium]
MPVSHARSSLSHAATPAPALRARVLALVVAVLLASPTRAQDPGPCDPQWLPGESAPGVYGIIDRALVLPDGDVVVGGDFTLGGVATHRVVRYNSSTHTWSSFGLGLASNAGVTSLVSLQSDDVIVSGRFVESAGAGGQFIARGDPNTGLWTDIGSGFNSWILCLAMLPDGDVVAAGNFTTTGEVAANRVARYHPATSTWSALGSGTSFPVSAIAVLPDGDVVAAGTIVTSADMTNYISRYDTATNTWTTLGSGTGYSDYVIWDLGVLPDGDVVVGGFFYSINGVPARHLARYDLATGTWSALASESTGTGPSLNAYIYCLEVLSDGDIIVGGQFSSIDGVAVNNIARLDSSAHTWSALSEGTNYYIRTLAVLPDGDIVAGGRFTTAGSFASDRFARYTFGHCPECPADLDDGSGTGTPDSAVTIDDLLYFLGLFQSGEVAADLDDGNGTGTPDGAVTIDDLLFFLDHFNSGC